MSSNKSGFNPRINKSNVYKMTTEELDIFNKHLEVELKNTKKPSTIKSLNQNKHNYSQQVPSNQVRESKFKKSNIIPQH
jgi:hypothetical protein